MNKFAKLLLALAAILTGVGVAIGANPNDFGQVLGSSRVVGGLSTIRVPIVIVAGNTFQTILPASAGRRSLTVQNNNGTDSCWLDFGQSSALSLTGIPSGTSLTAAAATKTGAILLLAGGSYSRYYPYTPSDELQATCTTTADTMRVEYQ